VELGRALGRLPGRLLVVGVEASRFDRGAPMSEPVASAVPEAARAVLSALDGGGGQP
jgi:hydrogenase maturation protease